MELTSCQSLSYVKFPIKPLISSHDSLPPATLFPSTASVFAHNSVNVLGFKCLPRKLQCSTSARQLRNFGAIHASQGGSSSADVAERWLLEPIGDGDTRHIGFKTGMPGAFEIASSVVTVGRASDKADVVIPVPTVSGVHARIQKTEETLLITDLDSTNGTFVDERRLRPGVAAIAPPGSKITFGDTHLAIFRVSKLEAVDANEPEVETETEDEPDNN